MSYDALLEWARGAGVVTAGSALELGRQAESRPRDADRVLAGARELRESLHALFSAVAQDKSPSASVLATLAGHLGAGFRRHGSSFRRARCSGHRERWPRSRTSHGSSRARRRGWSGLAPSLASAPALQTIAAGGSWTTPGIAAGAGAR